MNGDPILLLREYDTQALQGVVDTDVETPAGQLGEPMRFELSLNDSAVRLLGPCRCSHTLSTLIYSLT